MAHLRKPLPVKLFIGMLSPEPALFAECSALFRAAYGPIDLESEALPWSVSEYYRDEMGGGLYRKFVFFDGLMDPDRLPAVKLFAAKTEAHFPRLSTGPLQRRINLDPGYITEAKVVLATTKDFSHRIYIGSGVYAEVTLRYDSKEQSFAALDHTYFDFRTPAYIAFFNRARLSLRERLGR